MIRNDVSPDELNLLHRRIALFMPPDGVLHGEMS
jgi:hypothetical protein